MKRKGTLPSLIRIGSVRIAVLRKSLTRTIRGKRVRVAGLFFDAGKRLEITVDPKCADDLVQSTFFHELVHAALYLSSTKELLNDKTEENVCDAVANALNDLIADGHLTLHARKDAAWKSRTR